MTPIIIKLLPNIHFERAQQFYTSVGYHYTINPSSTILVALEEKEIIGIVRLETEENMLVLRGMQILPTHQRQGIGSRMLQELDTVIGNTTCWCLPHSWLADFYGKIGFVKIEEHKAPLFLQKRLNKSRTEYPHLIVMVKNLR